MRVEDDRVSAQPATPAAQEYAGAALSRHHVRVCHDEAGAGHPAAALDAEPAGLADDLHDRRGRRTHAVRVDDRLVRRGHIGDPAGDVLERIDASERIEDRSGWRERLVEVTEDQ